jgi:hypothetical protein
VLYTPVHKVPAGYFRIVHVESGEEIGGINLRLESRFLSSASKR